ncbi:MAG: ATP-binding cassette domain-containing protein [Candidatus Omnitrophica bacterium]|nr:ATP-binding cassette domain-containing protein [Candidatus Omnitrophota bacterium]
MISANGISLHFGARKLFSDVNIIFSPGNCYGLIGANGSGKSTFLKILSGELESTAGEVAVTPGERIAVLKQDQFAFDGFTALNTVIMGHKRLYDIIEQKESLHAKKDFSDKDGMDLADLEAEFSMLDGWNAESDAAKLLSDLGITEEFHGVEMKQLEEGQKVRVLLAQALFGNPDILLLDEPTNHLDIENCMWLENFLSNFKNTAVVVSHDRHFLDKVCTHIADIDYGKIQLYPGNFTFWMESTQLVLRQRIEANKKIERKREELKSFIARFSANASKAKQATSRKKILEKLTLEDIIPSSRRSPYINFEQSREAGNNVLAINGLSRSLDGLDMFKGLAFTVEKGDKIAFVGSDDLANTTLFQVLAGEAKPDGGSYKWGASVNLAYYPKDNAKYFDSDSNLIDWLRQYSNDADLGFVRGFLGRMLFSGDESLKQVRVLSGGERVRCMLSRMMVAQPNVMILDQPTNHLDLESIEALNKGLEKFEGTLLFASHDHQLIQTVANRIIEITADGFIDRSGITYDEYLSDRKAKGQPRLIYS